MVTQTVGYCLTAGFLKSPASGGAYAVLWSLGTDEGWCHVLYNQRQVTVNLIMLISKMPLLGKLVFGRICPLW